MRKIILLSLIGGLLVSGPAIAQNWGIGFRLGDPSGITLKHHFNGKALELSVGRTGLFSGSNYYSRAYGRWYDRKHFGYKDHQFLNYGSSLPIGVQLHYLFQKNINGVEGLDWYFGFGGQLRSQQYQFDYRYKLEGNNEWVYVRGESVRSVDFGVDGVIGMEYKFKNAPISVFADATLYMELFDNPFLFWPQGGIGGRFRF